jgi:N-acetylmuramic acid 6-phosphate etherase
MMDERSSLTGRWNPRSAHIDTMPAGQIIELMNDEDTHVAETVRSARDAVVKAVLHAVECINAGGSLIYIGAGTSGRLAVLDAADLPRAFNVPPGTVRAIMAGGVEALTGAVEGASEDESAGRAAVADIRPIDMCMGITAGGRTPYVLAALGAAKERGARCWLLTFNDVDYPFLDGIIKVLTGAELITGSTRLKAGTATKMVLNMLSTAVIIRLGYVHDGYTVDVAPTDARLADRARAIVASITGCPEEEGGRLLSAAGGSIKTALVMHVKCLTRDEATARLKAAGGNLRKALE